MKLGVVIVVIIMSGTAVGAFILIIIALALGCTYSIVDLFSRYWIYLFAAPGIMCLIRSVIISVRNCEFWHGVWYFILDCLRIFLTYITIMWFACDWLGELDSGINGILSFLIKVFVEGFVVISALSIAIGVSWSALAEEDLSEDCPWVFPIISMVIIILPLGIRMIVERINNGVFIPKDFFKMIFKRIN